jgi:hypothetical protein
MTMLCEIFVSWFCYVRVSTPCKRLPGARPCSDSVLRTSLRNSDARIQVNIYIGKGVNFRGLLYTLLFNSWIFALSFIKKSQGPPCKWPESATTTHACHQHRYPSTTSCFLPGTRRKWTTTRNVGFNVSVTSIWSPCFYVNMWIVKFLLNMYTPLSIVLWDLSRQTG